MKISNQSDYGEKYFGYEKAIRYICEAGFEAIDYSMYKPDIPIFGKGAEKQIKEMKSIADGFGVTFNQAHAPFPHVKFGEGDAEYNKKLHSLVLRSIEIAGELGAEQIIVHPIDFPSRCSAEKLEKNLELFSDFVEKGKACRVKIAIENMWDRNRDSGRICSNVCSTGEELRRYVDAFNSEWVGACLDVGHSGLIGECADTAVRALGDRLISLHLHDNDFVSDAHTIPFLGKMNYKALIASLAEIDYKGDLTLEADGIFPHVPKELYVPTITYMKSVLEYMRAEILAQKS